MKHVFIGIFLTFGLLFTASSGILKGEAFAYEYRNNYYQEDELQGYDKNGYDKGYDKEDLYGLDKEFLEGIDTKALLDTAMNLLKGLDLDALNEQLLQEGGGGSGYAGGFVLILVLFILLVIIGAGFGLG